MAAPLAFSNLPVEDPRVTKDLEDLKKQWLAQVQPVGVTALPTAGPNGGALVDGQEIYYLADSTNGVYWHLKYCLAEASALKWYYVGGPPLVSEVDGAETTASAAYANLSGGATGPSITVPLAGDYDVFISAKPDNATSAAMAMSYAIGGTAAVDADSVTQFTNTALGSVHMNRTNKQTGLAAATVLLSKYKTSAGTATFTYRRMSLLPFRVG